MKTAQTFLRFFLLLIPLSGFTQTTWYTIAQPGTEFIIVNEQNGYSFLNETVGSHGMSYTLKKSADGFQSFIPVRSNSGQFGCYSLDEMFFLSPDTGWIVEVCQGMASILRTNDGGQNWAGTGFGGTYGMSLYFLNDTLGYYSFWPGASNSSYLFRNSTNVFTTFKYRFSKDNYLAPTTSTRIRFINDSTGFITCSDTLEQAVILKTTDRGVHWAECYVTDSCRFFDLMFLTDSTGWVTGSGGTLLKTVNCGQDWQKISSNTLSDLRSLDMTPEGKGLVAGSQGTLLYTDDFGESWSPMNFPDTTGLIYVRLFSNDHLFVLGANGTLYSNQSNIGIKETQNTAFRIFPNPAKDQLTIHGSTDAAWLISAKIYNPEGRCLTPALPVYLQQGTNNATLNLRPFPDGLYFLTLTYCGQTTSLPFEIAR